jgi:hypothetical protein
MKKSRSAPCLSQPPGILARVPSMSVTMGIGAACVNMLLSPLPLYANTSNFSNNNNNANNAMNAIMWTQLHSPVYHVTQCAAEFPNMFAQQHHYSVNEAREIEEGYVACSLTPPEPETVPEIDKEEVFTETPKTKRSGSFQNLIPNAPNKRLKKRKKHPVRALFTSDTSSD